MMNPVTLYMDHVVPTGKNKKKFSNAWRFVFYSLLFIIAFSTVYAQPSLLNKAFSGDYHDTPLALVIRDISKQTGIRFSYSSKKIPEQEKINGTFKEKPLNAVLDEIFRSLPVSYEQIDNYIILKKGVPAAKKEQTSQKISINGYIKDNETGEFLIGATVYIPELAVGTISNNYGYFSLTIPPGRYTLVISFIGYEDIKQALHITSSMKANFTIRNSPKKLEEVTVSSYKKEDVIFKMNASQSAMKPPFVEQQPSFMGEPEVLKMLEFEPGISFYGDGSSYFHVRGGNYDQNLILLDEATIFNPSHMLGLFSPIISDAIKSVDIYKADFPVNYGGRLSSVIDVRTRDGSNTKFCASGSLGLVSTRSTIEGPIVKDKSSFFVSFRRSYFDAFLKPRIPGLLGLYFYDFTTKFNIQVSRRDRIFLTFYKGEDVFRHGIEQDTNGMKWGNTSATLRWNHIFGSRFFANTTLYSSKYEYFLYSSMKNDEYWNSKVNNTSLKHELTFFLSPGMTLRCGINGGFYNFNPGNYNASIITEDYTVSQVNSFEGSLYAGVEHTLAPWLRLNYGARLVHWSDYGEAFVVDFNEAHEQTGTSYYKEKEKFYEKNGWEPRLSASIKANDYNTFKLSYGRTHQFLNLITNSISPFSSLEVWLPTGPNIKPQYADITDAGYIHYFRKLKTSFQADVYYKWMYNQIGYVDHASMLINPAIEGEIRQGDGYCYGFEVSLKKEGEVFSSTIAYSFSRAFVQIDDLNNGKEFSPVFDRPHHFNLNIACNVRPRWMLSCNLVIASGARITTPTSFYYYKGYQVPYYSSLNNDRMPTYKRFDFSSRFQLSKSFRRYQHFLVFSIYNMYLSQNPMFLYYNKIAVEDKKEKEKYLVPADRENNPELVTTMRYAFVFIPSLSYQFHF